MTPSTDADCCPICGDTETLYKRHCKIVCEDCGVLYDCADPFR